MTYVGIDGGGTTTRLFVQAGDDEPRYFEFPISLKVRDGDFAASAQKLRKIVAQTLVCDSLPEGSQTKVCATFAIGLSGMSKPENQEAFKNALHALPEFEKTKIHIESDATLTLKTVLAEGEEGILIIAGTGSVVFYQPAGGAGTIAHPRRIGGWGPLLSDEGSGYRIGLRALRYYMNVLDGVFPRDAFSEAIEARIGNPEISRSQKSLAKRAENDPAFVASFAQDAFETARDLKHVQDFIHEELLDLITLLFPIFFLGVMSGRTPYPLYLAGRIAQQPMTVHAIETAFDEGDFLTIHLVAERAPAAKALEMARML
ncbi:MAG: N-acetylglucosamine kinase [Candidatus Kapaibacterium sp.]